MSSSLYLMPSDLSLRPFSVSPGKVQECFSLQTAGLKLPLRLLTVNLLRSFQFSVHVPPRNGGIIKTRRCFFHRAGRPSRDPDPFYTSPSVLRVARWVSIESESRFSKPFFSPARLDGTLGWSNEHPKYDVLKSSPCEAVRHFGQTGGARGDKARLYGSLPHGPSSLVFVSCCFRSFLSSSHHTSISSPALSPLLKVLCFYSRVYVCFSLKWDPS